MHNWMQLPRNKAKKKLDRKTKKNRLRSQTDQEAVAAITSCMSGFCAKDVPNQNGPSCSVAFTASRVTGGFYMLNSPRRQFIICSTCMTLP